MAVCGPWGLCLLEEDSKWVGYHGKGHTLTACWVWRHCQATLVSQSLHFRQPISFCTGPQHPTTAILEKVEDAMLCYGGPKNQCIPSNFWGGGDTSVPGSVPAPCPMLPFLPLSANGSLLIHIGTTHQEVYS